MKLKDKLAHLESSIGKAITLLRNEPTIDNAVKVLARALYDEDAVAGTAPSLVVADQGKWDNYTFANGWDFATPDDAPLKMRLNWASRSAESLEKIGLSILDCLATRISDN